jgi:hypothetical protein
MPDDAPVMATTRPVVSGLQIVENGNVIMSHALSAVLITLDPDDFFGEIKLLWGLDGEEPSSKLPGELAHVWT